MPNSEYVLEIRCRTPIKYDDGPMYEVTAIDRAGYRVAFEFGTDIQAAADNLVRELYQRECDR